MGSKGNERRAFVDPIWIKEFLPGNAIFDLMSVQMARDIMRPVVVSGEKHECPCCGQNVKIYPRSISSTMVRQLAYIYHHGATHPRDLMAVCYTGDYAKLGSAWELIEKIETEGDDYGKWRVTAKGVAWLRGEIRIPRYALIFNQQVYAWSQEQWLVSAAAGNDFSLSEILNKYQTPDDNDD